MGNEAVNEKRECKFKHIFNSIDKFLLKINSIVIKFFQNYWLIFALVAIAALGIVIRVPLFSKKSGDYNNFLLPWYRQVLELGPKEFLANDVGDYTPTYMYVICFASFLKLDPDTDAYLHYLKIISIIFDYGSAVLIFIMSKFNFKKSDLISILGFSLALFVPNIFINSAFWAQCDSIFTFFIILSIYFVLNKHPILSVAMFSISFTLKLQSIFFLPVLVLLWMKKNIKFRYFFLIPIIYILMCLPAIICGRSFISCILVYFNQAGEYTYLSMNCPNIYSFMYYTMKGNISVTEHLVPAATVLGISILIVAALSIFLTHEGFNKEDIVKIAFFLTLLAPYVLPNMHDRYFYLSDVCAILYLITNPKKWYISALGIAGSFQGYVLYCFNTYYFNNRDVNLLLGASLILASLILLGFDIFKNKKVIYGKLDKNLNKDINLKQ